MVEVKKKIEEKKVEEPVKMKGRFIQAVGRRKTATAQVRLYKSGTGILIVNGVKMSEYFPADLLAVAVIPLKLTGHNKEYDFSIVTSGGGKSGQAGAVKLGISKVLLELNKDLRPVLKSKDLLTRDSRRKERKKPGLKRARKAPQWSKR